MDKNLKKKFIRGSAATSFGQAASMVFHFVSIMILTRVMSKGDFGIYALILVINNLFLILGGLGLDVTLVKYVAGGKDGDKKSVFTKIIGIKIFSLSFFSLVFILTGNLFLPLIDAKILDYLFYIPILFFFGSYRDLFYKVLQGLNYFKKYAIIQIVSAVSRLALILFFYFRENLTLDSLVFIEILTVFIVIMFEFKIVPFRMLIDKNANSIQVRTILNFTLPIYFNNIFTFMYGRINLFIIGAFLNPVSVAFYDVGARIPGAFKKMFNSLILVFFPNLSNLFSKGDKSTAERIIGKSLSTVSIMLSFAVLVSFLFKDEIMVLLFSKKYIESSFVFSFLMLNFMLRAFANLLGYSNLSAGYSKVPMKVNIVSSTISITGAVLFIPEFGYIGAAYALIIMNTLAQALYLFYLNKVNIKVNVVEYIKPLTLMILVSSVYWFMNLDSITVKSITILVYLTLSWMLITESRELVISLFKIILKFKT